MPKVDPDVLKAFGRAVKLARGKRGWNQKELGNAFKPPIGNSIISKVEKGQKDTLGFTTVGRFRQVLDLDESWLEKFLDAEEAAESLETRAEKDADQVVDRLHREGLTEGASDDLLIQLANNFTEGDHRDRETAYQSVRSALIEFASNKNIAALADNADKQFAALMERVDQLNEGGDFEEAARLLDEEQVRQEQVAALQLKKQLGQDRLRNRPDLAAQRIVQDHQRYPKGGKLFQRLGDEATRRSRDGHNLGDIFLLRTGANIAETNLSIVGNKRHNRADAHETVGVCYFNLGEHLLGIDVLHQAKKAFNSAVKLTPKEKFSEDWTRRMDGLGQCQMRIGERNGDIETLEAAAKTLRQAYLVAKRKRNQDSDTYLHNFGRTKSIIGYQKKDADILKTAVNDLVVSLGSYDPVNDIVSDNNVALSRKRLGEIASNASILSLARKDFAAHELELDKVGRPFSSAITFFNIADLALVRFRLDPDPVHLVEARTYLAEARAVFVEGSEYQTQRCDELLADIDAAEAEHS